MWDSRNKAVHGKDQQEIITKKLQLLRQETKDIISDLPLLGASDLHLLQSQDVDKKKGRQLHQLLRVIRTATRKEAL